MDAMMSMIYTWLENLVKFEESHGVNNTLHTKIVLKSDHKEEEEAHILIVEGFLLYSNRPLINMLNQCHFFPIPHEEYKKRRCYRNYTVAPANYGSPSKPLIHPTYHKIDVFFLIMVVQHLQSTSSSILSMYMLDVM
uniref:Muscle-specific beta 1 integrin binding protein 2 n=1 Tax=Stegastes partitus TaxID=144197 RepID=A0A3B5B0M9_9TELE